MPDNKRKNNTFLKFGHYKCVCGREFENSQSYNGHLSHCKLHRELTNKPEKRNGFHTIKKDYKCVCGKVFKSNASYVGHTSHCKVYLGEEKYLENREKHTHSLITFNSSITGNEWHKKHDAGLKKQSETRKQKYKTGELKPAKGVGRGKYSYIIINNERIMLRSTYEFIFAIWLFLNNKPINVEQIRVNAYRKNKYSDTFISDFNIDNKVYEIKGIPSGKDIYIKESFENAGYEFKILYDKDIMKLKDEIEKYNFSIDDKLEQIIIGHNSKNYYELNLDNYRI